MLISTRCRSVFPLCTPALCYHLGYPVPRPATAWPLPVSHSFTDAPEGRLGPVPYRSQIAFLFRKSASLRPMRGRPGTDGGPSSGSTNGFTVSGHWVFYALAMPSAILRKYLWPRSAPLLHGAVTRHRSCTGTRLFRIPNRHGHFRRQSLLALTESSGTENQTGLRCNFQPSTKGLI